MKKCFNCHQRSEKLNADNLCEDCFDAKYPDSDYKPVYDYAKGKSNKERVV